MKLYHISAGVDLPEKTFIPRIPNYEGEEKCTPRICFSETINGCFMAVPPETRRKIDGVGDIFTLYTLDTKQHPDAKILSNNAMQDLVFDANITKEAWCLSPITLKGVVCEITDMEGCPILNFKHISAQEIIDLAEEISGLRLRNNPAIDMSSSEACYESIMDLTENEKYEYACDDLFEAIGEANDATQAWEIRIKYKDERGNIRDGKTNKILAACKL